MLGRWHRRASLFFATSPLALHAQSVVKVHQVGTLGLGYPLPANAADRAADVEINAFRERLGQLGYVEGRNLVLQRRFGNVDALAALASDLIRLGGDEFRFSTAQAWS